MKINQLQAVIALNRGRGMAGAAEELSVSIPAITKSISNLEQELGVELLDRSGYRAVLNAYGERLAQHARIITAEIDEARRQLQLMKSQSHGLVRVNSSPGVIPKLLAEATHRMRTVLPHAYISFEGHLVGHPREKLEGLANGEYDLLISPINPSSDLSSFRYEVLLDVKFKVMARRGHPATQLRNPTLEQLREYSWLLPGAKEGPPFDAMKRVFSDSNTRLPEEILHLPTREMAFSLLNKGTYLVLMPYHEKLFERGANDFAFIESEQVHQGWSIYMLQRRTNIPSEATRVLIEKLREIVSEPEPY